MTYSLKVVTVGHWLWSSHTNRHNTQADTLPQSHNRRRMRTALKLWWQIGRVRVASLRSAGRSR